MTFFEKYQNSGILFAEKLKELRLLKDKSIKLTSEKLKISTKQYTRWEAGDLPPWDKLIMICDYFQYDFLCLMFSANSNSLDVNQISNSGKIKLDLEVISYAVSRISERLQASEQLKLGNANKQVSKDSGRGKRTPGRDD